MTDFEVCPMFIKMVGSENNVHVNTVLQFFQDKLVDKNEQLLPNKIIVQKLLQNVTKVILEHFPFVYDENKTIISLEDCQQIRFSYIITNTANNCMDFNTFIHRGLQLFRKLGKDFHKFVMILVYIFFQVFLSCTILECCSFFHNDLHFQNILISPMKSPCQFVCNFHNDVVVKYQLNYPLLIKIYDFDSSHVFNKANSFCIGESFNCKHNTLQLKMLLGIFVRSFIHISGSYDLNDNESKLFHEYLDHKIIKHFLKKTKFTVYQDDRQINVDEQDTISAFFRLFENCRFERLTDDIFENNFNTLDYIIDQIYNDKDFIRFNKENSQKVLTYYITKDMFDEYGTFSLNKQNEFRQKQIK
jgi:hypothetical protein